MTELDIAEVVRRAGVPASTLRYYEEKGLITPVGRRGLRRQYDPAVLERLALIALARTAGFPLDEIARVFAPNGAIHIDREALVAKAGELDRRIAELAVLRDSLRHVAACPAPGHMECPTFRRILAATVSSDVPVRRKRAPGQPWDASIPGSADEHAP
ncbi:helix-turn-helix domain-containing protein [Streptomyces sp. NPDC059690]|uniref:helix-turn-helix domain-containing protein n=1 Tax=Streptomyces sp. NPDC059690 TaxID=3346907 RepID=UPI0036B09E01